MRPDLLISIQRILDQATTITGIGHYPTHIAKLSAWHTKRLLKGGAIQLPRDADGVRITLELANNKKLSLYSHRVICKIIQGIEMPKLSQQQRQQGNSDIEADYLVRN